MLVLDDLSNMITKLLPSSLFPLPTQMPNPNAWIRILVCTITLPSPQRHSIPCNLWYNAALDDVNADAQNAQCYMTPFAHALL